MSFRLFVTVFFVFCFVVGNNAQTVTIPTYKDGNVKVPQTALPVTGETAKSKMNSNTEAVTVITQKPENLTAKNEFFCSNPNRQPKKKKDFDTKAVGSLDCGDYGAQPCYWTKPFLLVGFINGTPEMKQVVKEVIGEWTTWANVGFIFNDNANFAGDTADIKILFGNEGHNSYLGVDSWRNIIRNRGKNYPTMNLSFLNRPLRYTDGTIIPNVNGTILHEFGHALGLEHEHQHPVGGIKWNREAVIRSLSGPPNNWDTATIESNIFRGLNFTRTQYTQYDRSSIMHYSFPAEWTMNALTIPENNVLSETDKSFIAKVYPRKKAIINTSQYYRLTTWYQNKQNCLGLGRDTSANGTVYFPYFFACDRTNTGQLWKFTKMNNGDYRLTNYLTGDTLSLDDPGVNYYTGMGASGNYSNQYWTVTTLGNFYRFSSMLNGISYSLTASTNPNTRTFMNRTGHWANQLWELIPAGNAP